MYQDLKAYGRVRVNEPLSKHTTFKIGGPAEFFIVIEETEKLIELLKFLDGNGTPYFILGGGSNMLVSDEGVRGVVIKVKSQKLKVSSQTLIVDAGCITVTVAQESIKAELTGFEWGVGVPGTIGGAIRGNAGAMGGEMKDVVESVTVYKNGDVIELQNKECEFNYRESVFKHTRDTILEARLRLNEGKVDAQGMKKAIEHLQYRNKTQPQGWASTGCIFKNVDLLGEHGEPNRLRLLSHFDAQDEKICQFLHVGKISAGWLVEQAGMKGKQVGNALVSERHGNFIVNLGGATAHDVHTLIEQIKERVYDKFGVELEEEIQNI